MIEVFIIIICLFHFRIIYLFLLIFVVLCILIFSLLSFATHL